MQCSSNFFRHLLSSQIAILLLLSFGGCEAISDKKTLRLAHGLDNKHPVHLGMEYMAELLAEKSGDKLTIDIYPSGQLGGERQCLELLQIGSLAMTKVSGAVLENFSPNAKVLSLPYLFKSKEHAYAFYDSDLGRQILTDGDQFRLRGLVYFDAGFRSFYTKDKQVTTPDDLKGQKIRVQQSASAIALVKALGGAPTPISYGELYTGLQQGVVDGAENNPPSFYTSRHYEVCKFYTLNEHTSVPDVLMIGTEAWQRLSPQEQQWLQEAANEAAVYQRKLWQEAEAEALAAVEKAGVTILRPDKTAFIAQTREILEGYGTDPETTSLIQQILALDQDEK